MASSQNNPGSERNYPNAKQLFTPQQYPGIQNTIEGVDRRNAAAWSQQQGGLSRTQSRAEYLANITTNLDRSNGARQKE
ncbi:hypothetical protein JMJ35_007889 [Cladonia borealis]|uniref:Uncharacterized protein n=1 Tax=Cladonia borealis TaxID=184061 RepID=A0AA39QWR2_9LECA|nr:hypothetical protein JMJ35_007889 [Cladonia borealis]